MSGGSETPRQKMIGMMYLVLTALLALNVSTTVLDKFAFINQSLEQANGETSTRNSQTLSGMTKSVEEKGNRKEDLEVIAATEQLRARTQEVLASLEESKETFVEITGGYSEGAKETKDRMHIEGKTNYDKVGSYMMPKEDGGDGNGEPMQELLNGYTDFVRDLLEKNGAEGKELSKFHKLALDADEDEYWKKDPNQRGKKWSQLNFHDSPTHAALATVSEFQANVLGFETAAMDFLKKRVGLKDLTFDDIKPVVMPESRYVAAGTKYVAEMFIAASASGLNDQIKMSYNGTAIPVADGIGKVEFTATPGSYDKEGNAKKTFEAAINVPLGGGLDTTFTSTIEYFVSKPVIQIQSQSVNALYLNCGNKLDVQVPALGNAYNPTFRAQGGDALKGSERGQVTVVPKSRKVVLTVSSNGNTIGSREFGVRAIPAPAIKVGTDQGEVNLKDGIPAKTPRLFLIAEPDASFKEFLPDDAKFIVAEAELTLVSGGLGRGSMRAGGQVNLSQINRNARKGDIISIEIKKVQRQNFRKQVEDFGRFQRFISIPLK
ncbi:MAG: gliding motility protein GldM [Cyclobacteriaceae bacterium]